ncbi:ABC transporter permease [Ohtaekwangia koreensis]|nr:ABC transporter permease [Ohtaekwangia koreensis]
MKKQSMHPPRWAERFLEWYCRPALLEDLQGDLHEYFERNLKAKGLRRARFIYIMDVFKFFRSYTVRKPEFINLLIHWIMIGSYIKTSGRSIVRNKLFSGINIIGLAISMSVGLMMIAFVSDLFSYDDFHENGDRIYRVNTTDQRTDQRPFSLATSSVKAGRRIQETISGIEKVTLLRRGFGGDAKVGEATIPISGVWADEAFFNVFSFPLLQGDMKTALKEPYSIVLTEKSAKKIFGEGNALGQSVKFDTANYIVTGVMKDIPKLSHMRFDVLVSFVNAEMNNISEDGSFMDWTNIYSNYTYIVLPESGNPEHIQASLNKLSAKENIPLDNRKIELKLQPLYEIALQAKNANPIGPSINKIAIWIMIGLALIVILSACFNYTNLSIARSLRRSREVGIRKVMGAKKTHVIGQFVAEAIIISLLALVLSLGMFLLLRTQFLSLAPFFQDMLSLDLSPRLILWFLLMAIGVGIVAGILPALFFARLNTIKVLKDASSLQVFRHVTMRKAMIVIQYTFSLIFITATIIGYKQYRSFLTFDLGFTTDNIVNIKLNGVNGDFFVKDLKELPEVEDVSRSLLVTSLGNIYGTQLKYEKLKDSANVWVNMVDENYLPLHQHRFLAGRNFNPKTKEADETEVIVNEQILHRFNMAGHDPAKAIGEEVTIDGKKLTIVGVVKDFHYGTLEDEIQPLVLRHSSIDTYGYINAKIKTSDWPATFAAMEKAWKKIDPVHPLEARFYSEQIEEAYQQFSVMVKLIGFLSFLAVCIAFMGLLGMVVFTTETRLKEISIRKVLGASERRLIYLLSKGFIALLAIAALIALPATYIFFDKVVLVNFAYHQPIHFTELVIGLLVTLVLATVMIGSQTLKVARSNPAEVLKNE